MSAFPPVVFPISGITHHIVIVTETSQVKLLCVSSVEGEACWAKKHLNTTTIVMNVNVSTTDKNKYDKNKYGSSVDCSLIIRKTEVSDSGLYYCNNKLAAQLLVLPAGRN